MTRKELTNKRDLTFSGWIREKLPDSSSGFMVSDLDFILSNYKTKKIMLLEIKTRLANLKTWQRNLFEQLSGWLEKGMDSDWQYLGFNVVYFTGTNFTDGDVFFNKQSVTEDELIKILSF